MRLRFWLGFAVVAAIAVGSIAVALVVHDRESDSFETAQRRRGAARRPPGGSAGRASRSASWPAPRPSTRRRATSAATSSTSIADSLLAAGRADRRPASSARCRGAQRARFERSARLPDPRTRPARRAAPGPRPQPTTSRSSSPPPTAASACSRRSATTSAPTRFRGSYLLQARDSGRPAATPVMRLPVGGTGINVFRPVYRDGAPTATVGRAPRGPDRLRRRRLPRARPGPRGDDGAAGRRRRCAGRARASRSPGPALPREESATAPIQHRRPHLAARRPRPEPAGRRPAGDDRHRRPLAGGAAGGAGAGLEPQRTDAGTEPSGQPGPADRAEEPAPLRGGPAGRAGAQPPLRQSPGRC